MGVEVVGRAMGDAYPGRRYRQELAEPQRQSATWQWRGTPPYPRKVTTEVDSDFADSAGLRIEQAFALCSFASQLVGKAGQRHFSIPVEFSRRWIDTVLTT